jgi:phosphoribosylformylglycinamidine synthase subunit PurS
MGSIVVDVMLKPEILDPPGQAGGGALPRLGFEGFTDVRQGKRFVLTVDGDVTDDHLSAAREAAEKLLSNPVIEDVVSVRVLDEAADGEGEAQ